MSASVRDVARAAQVSVGTVSNVLNRPDRVSPEIVERVRAAIEQLGFVRNDAARMLRAGRARTIGLAVLDLRNPFFTEVARGAETRAGTDGLSVLVANSDQERARELTHLELFAEQRMLGALVSPVDDDTAALQRIAERGLPVVLVDRLSVDQQLPSVSVDDVAGGRMAAQHLLGTGRTRLAFVGGPVSLRQVADRLDGAQQAVAAAPGATLEFIGTSALTVDQGREAGARIADRSPQDRPTALFAANDQVAVGLMQSLVMSGRVAIPQDIALIGYDDIDFAASTIVGLSSVHQPAQLLGSTAVELLLDRANCPDQAPRQVVFTPELVVRASTAG